MVSPRGVPKTRGEWLVVLFLLGLVAFAVVIGALLR